MFIIIVLINKAFHCTKFALIGRIRKYFSAIENIIFVIGACLHLMCYIVIIYLRRFKRLIFQEISD